jgi:hypothetical protein
LADARLGLPGVVLRSNKRSVTASFRKDKAFAQLLDVFEEAPAGKGSNQHIFKIVN